MQGQLYFYSQRDPGKSLNSEPANLLAPRCQGPGEPEYNPTQRNIDRHI